MTDLPKPVAENIDRFTGRTWLLPRILEWLNHSNERFLPSAGGPGTGKSMILVWLAGFGPEPKDPVSADRLARVRKTVKGVHFCQAASRNITPQAFAENNSAVICAHVDQEGKSAIHVWNFKTWKHMRCIVKPVELIQSVKIASNGSHGFSVGVLNTANGILRLWDIQTGRTVAVVGLNRPFTCLASVPDGEIIILADNEGALYCYEYLCP